MNAFAMFSADQALRLATERAAELRAAAEAHRMASHLKGRPSRFAAVVASVRAAFRAPDTSRETTVVPRLTDYPYRS
jgi:hypothetical protein